MLIERLRRPLQTSTNWSTPTPAVRRVTGWRWQRVAWLPIKGASVSINPITAPTVYITRGISRIYWWAFPVLLSAHTHSNNIRVRSFDTQQQTMVAWWIYGSLALFNRSVTWTWRYCWRLKWSLTRTLKFPPIFMVSFSALYFCLDKFKAFKNNNDNNSIVFLCQPLMPWIHIKWHCCWPSALVLDGPVVLIVQIWCLASDEGEENDELTCKGMYKYKLYLNIFSVNLKRRMRVSSVGGFWAN